jgi:hypothetical protein
MSPLEARIAQLLLGESTDGRAQRQALAQTIVGVVLKLLEDASPQMLEAGRRELVPALPPNPGKHYQRNLVRAVWLTMLAEVGR